MRAVVSSAPIPILIHRAGELLYINQTALDELGYAKASELLGSSVLASLVHPDDASVVKQRIATLDQPSGAKNLPPTAVRLRRRDGSWAWIEASAAKVELHDGSAIVVMGRSVSRLREQSARFQTVFAVTAELEVARARVATEQRHLREANERLEASLDVLDQFAYIASHDLRTPLRGIQHLVHFIEADSPPEVVDAIAPRLAQLKERLSRMDNMLVALLAYSRSGHATGGHEPTDVRRVADDIARTLELGGDITFTVDTTGAGLDPLPLVRATVLEHVLMNLIGNAVGHSDRAHPRVEVRANRDGDALVVEVIDDGPGIAPAQHERAFQIFKTLTPKDRKPTTGMGLALVRRLVSRAGGEVTLQSPWADERGCCFRVVLPVASSKP